MAITKTAREEARRLHAEGLKRCSGCRETKGPDKFGTDARKWDGLQSQCRECHSASAAARGERRRSRWAFPGADPHADPAPKRCCSCKQDRPRFNFTTNPANADGLSNTCRECATVASSARRQRHRARWTAPGADPYAEPSSKVCGPCQQARPRADFSTNPSNVDGLNRICRGCDATRKATRDARKRDQFVEHVDRSVAWAMAGGICYLCDLPCDPTRWDLDHVDPIINGGEHSYFNTAPTHPSCNRSKNGTPWPDVSFDPSA